MTASRLDAIDLDSVRDGVEAAVRAANDAIRGVLAQATMKVESKGEDGPVTEADYAADAVLHEQLMPLISGARWLSEESSEEPPLIRGEATWIIDPLDGTREFLRGLPEYGVSVGLFVDDRLVLGAVGFPWDGTVLSGLVTRDRRESRRDGVPMAMLANDGVVERVVVSRHDYEHRRLQYRIPYEVYPCGSAAVKLVHAAQIATDVYFSTGPRSVWDVAGGVAVLEGVGGVLMSIEGKQIALSPQQIHVPPYVAGAPADCLTLLQQTGLLARTLQTPPVDCLTLVHRIGLLLYLAPTPHRNNEATGVPVALLGRSPTGERGYLFFGLAAGFAAGLAAGFAAGFFVAANVVSSD